MVRVIPWVHEAFRERAREQPDAVALRFNGNSVSYGELDQRVNRLARALLARGAGPGSVVGIAARRSPELVVALLATLTAGAAYLPLDPDYPVERIRFMIEDAGPTVLLAQAELGSALPGGDVMVLDVESAADGDDTPLQVTIDGASPAYLIYTSGSTGRPKGVLVAHAGLRNRIGWMQDTFLLGAADRVLQKTPSSFDVSVWEFFWPLATGATMVLAEPGGHLDMAYLAELIEAERVSTVHFVPSVLRLFLAEEGASRCTGLRRVFCSGEALPKDLVRAFLDRLPGELHNLYGPTEATVDVTWWPCAREDDGVPIGRPVRDTEMYVLDALGQQVPPGEVGEICVGGVQVALGYLNRPGLTAQRFAPDEFSGRPGARLYRTGDLGRFRVDGALEFLGRADHQVKIHGNRIELGEIESHLAEHPDVAEAAVTVADRDGTPVLVAHVVPAVGVLARTSLLVAHLRARLPAAMVPTRMRFLARMPLTPSGKTDRAALVPAPPGPSLVPRWQPAGSPRGRRIRVPVRTEARDESTLLATHLAVVGALTGQAYAGTIVDGRQVWVELGGSPEGLRDRVHHALQDTATPAGEVNTAFGKGGPKPLVFDAEAGELEVDTAWFGPVHARTIAEYYQGSTVDTHATYASVEGLIDADDTTVVATQEKWRSSIGEGWDGDPLLRLVCLVDADEDIDPELMGRLSVLGRSAWCTWADRLVARLDGGEPAFASLGPVRVLDRLGRDASVGVHGELVLDGVRTGRMAVRLPDGRLNLAPVGKRP